MLRDILVGVAGSAAALAIDLFVVRWSGDSNGVRIGVAFIVFVLAFLAAKLLPRPASSKRQVLSENVVDGTMSVDTKEVSGSGAEKLLSSNKVRGDMSIKADKINS